MLQLGAYTLLLDGGAIKGLYTNAGRSGSHCASSNTQLQYT